VGFPAAAMEVKALAAGCSLPIAFPSVAASSSASFRCSAASTASSSLAAPIRSLAITCAQSRISPKGLKSSTFGGSRCPSRAAVGAARAAQVEKSAFVDVELEEEEREEEDQDEDEDEGEGEDENSEGGFGEVDLILASRVVDKKTQYLILWKDDHPDSWEPAGNIAGDVVGEFEKPWWQAARKADVEKLQELLDDEELQRDVNTIDENERTALFFAAGLGNEKCVRLRCEYGADVHWQVWFRASLLRSSQCDTN
jgi:hypothetical protein